MKTITIRVEDDVFNKIEEHRGLKSKSEFYRKLIEDYLNNPEDNMNKTEEGLNKHEDCLNNAKVNLNKSEYVQNILKENEAMKADLAHKQELLKMSNDWINDMRNQVGFLQFEYQKISGRLALTEARKWWEFWKK
ncbi:MAG: hypothetical protein OIN85_01615 [Candidatus Methanoperedens sp.]|nr:hypothetical protein [Candidatus Methanoperedens sp.]